MHRGENVAKLAKEDTRPLPRATEPMELDPQVRLICPVGGVILFSGQQMHSSVPNTSGVTRFSIDFRTVHLTTMSRKLERRISIGMHRNSDAGLYAWDGSCPGYRKRLCRSMTMAPRLMATWSTCRKAPRIGFRGPCAELPARQSQGPRHWGRRLHRWASLPALVRGGGEVHATSRTQRPTTARRTDLVARRHGRSSRCTPCASRGQT